MDIADLTDLVNLHGKSIYGFCYNLAKNKADTDDLYQETFLKAMELRHKINKDNNPKGFLISIAIGIWKNKRRKYIRRQKIAPVHELNEDVDNGYKFKDDSTLEDIVISNDFRARVQAVVNTLDNKLRMPLYMYYTAEMSTKEIASTLKIPQGTVKSRLYKARKALKNILELEVSKYEEF